MIVKTTKTGKKNFQPPLYCGNYIECDICEEKKQLIHVVYCGDGKNGDGEGAYMNEFMLCKDCLLQLNEGISEILKD